VQYINYVTSRNGKKTQSKLILF